MRINIGWATMAWLMILGAISWVVLLFALGMIAHLVYHVTHWQVWFLNTGWDLAGWILRKIGEVL